MPTLVRTYEKAVRQAPSLQKVGLSVARSIHRAVLKGGEPTRTLADLLHGTWLGHPLHAVLIDVTLGAWISGGLFDVLSLTTGDPVARRAGDTLATAGTLSALPTALAGLTDYSTIPKAAASTATLHGTLNGFLVGMYLVSIEERRAGRHRSGAKLALSALGLGLVSAWLGGHLVYSYQVGTDHSQKNQGPQKWTPVLKMDDLREGKPACVEAQGVRVLLFKSDGLVSAIGAVCSHAGGPLEKGTFDGNYVECPWHNSVFDLRNGHIKHGPAVHAQPRFEVRVRKGEIEVRTARE
ncbi:MAG TPA: DUF2231 domain-containing protein [Rhodothermales bacterium]|nr:DUF2231 domain-containing protein [Rhodothermales bacterium]